MNTLPTVVPAIILTLSGTRKIALIDFVWVPFAKEYVTNLKKEIDLKTIDYIIANHGEPDHSGALPELMKEIPNTPIYCTD